MGEALRQKKTLLGKLVSLLFQYIQNLKMIKSSCCHNKQNLVEKKYVVVYLKRKKRVFFPFKFLRMPEQSLCKQDQGRCIILLDEEDLKKNYLYGKIYPLYYRNPWRWAKFCLRVRERCKSTLTSLTTQWGYPGCSLVMFSPQKVRDTKHQTPLS